MLKIVSIRFYLLRYQNYIFWLICSSAWNIFKFQTNLLWKCIILHVLEWTWHFLPIEVYYFTHFKYIILLLELKCLLPIMDELWDVAYFRHSTPRIHVLRPICLLFVFVPKLYKLSRLYLYNFKHRQLRVVGVREWEINNKPLCFRDPLGNIDHCNQVSIVSF